ncbi:MAG: cytochrome-c peroxidase [Ignavibacteria bacterium]|nr:cytochrome-c peroxidase [Ignavibacteria bacterium]MBK6419957.1 cytochrome-c peroxidase [Ignavibacteria bacterium]MBK7413106.1 cytochrome-c peroxidase [Ignavibacteria bacterium]MBL0323208.1 cytochrome-c peroxidase [Ignavibacteria bacterium]MBP7093280.1 cytochrome-c peroxidase [Candidatus Kapabacteria bacterium]
MLRSSSFGKGLCTVGIHALVILLTACANDVQTPPLDLPLIDQPQGFPAQEFPADNVPNADRIALGKILFFSTELSRTRSVSCASCHVQSKAFTDGLAVSVGVDDRSGTRNAPSLFNVGYGPYFLREGGVPTLEMQVLVPVQEHNEFDMNMLEVVDRFAADTAIQRMSRAAYDRDIDSYVITRAIASFERTLISGSSRADNNDLNASERRGKELFASERAGCSSCHGGFLYTTHTFANNGVYASYTDPGRQRLTFRAEDLNVFKVPSLRNVARTAPYMHNGGIGTLREVLEIYNAGGYAHPNKDPRLHALGLTTTELDELEAFLRTLTDERSLTDLRYRQ